MKRRRPEPRAPAIQPPGISRFAPAAVIIFVVAFAIRLLHIWQLRLSPYFSTLMGDARGYDAWAQRLARGDWVGTDVFYQAPLYPYFLGVIYAIDGRDLFSVRMIQAVVGSLSSVALGYAASRFVSPRAGVVAGLMLALYAPAIFFDALIQKSVLDVFFISLMLALVARIAGAPETRWPWLVLGIVMGALSLTRENALLLVAVLLVWAWRAERASLFRIVRVRRSVPAVVAFVFGLALVLLPVVARNYLVSGGFYLTTSQFGSNLYIGNNAKADGSYMSLRYGRGAPEYERQDATELAEQAVGRRLTPAQVSRYWLNRTMSFIATDPMAWLRLMARKAWLLINSTEMLDTESQESQAEWSSILKFGSPISHFGVLLPLAAVGVWALWPRRREVGIVMALAAAYAISVVVFFVFARYRFALVPFVILFAAAGILAIVAALRASQPKRLVKPLAVAAPLAMAANWPVQSEAATRAITETNLASALQEDGRTDEAIEHYQRAISLDPGYAPAHGNLGTALRRSGRTDEALAEYEKALALAPDFPSVHYNLGNLRLAQGDPDRAIEHFRRALALAPASVDAHNNLGMALASKGLLDEAIGEFQRALEIDPRAARVYHNLGNALATRGRMDNAIRSLQTATELDPSNGAIWYDLGSVFLELTRYENAVAAFTEALRRDPDSAEAHNNLGIALASTGRIEEAIAHWKRALEIKPGFADAERNLSLARK